jgi:hypothetical protein
VSFTPKLDILSKTCFGFDKIDLYTSVGPQTFQNIGEVYKENISSHPKRQGILKQINV